VEEQAAQMKIDTFGAVLIGSVLLGVGLSLLFTDIDPLALCFKRCDIPKAIASLLGQGALKILTGGFFVGVALLFLAPLVSKPKSRKPLE
jgi:hypothetical protein